jgi:hypothetical protein
LDVPLQNVLVVHRCAGLHALENQVIRASRLDQFSERTPSLTTIFWVARFRCRSKAKKPLPNPSRRNRSSAWGRGMPETFVRSYVSTSDSRRPGGRMYRVSVLRIDNSDCFGGLALIRLWN